MARRSQPYRLRWPLTAFQVEQIDEMFQLLFDDTHNGSLTIRASQISLGILEVARGGTGFGSYTIGDILYADGAQSLAQLAGVATGNALISGGVATAPSWGKIALTTHVSGVLPVANGGTDISSYTIGDLLYASGATTLSKLADVAAGAYLRSGGVATAPVWSSITLPNSAAVGDIWYASTTSAITALADVSVGSYLRSGGVNTAPLWSTVKLPNTATTGDLWYASASNTISALADVAVGSYLRSGGVATAPVWSTLTLPNAATTGDLLYASASNTISALAAQSAGRYLRSAGVTTAPAWSTLEYLATAATGEFLVATGTNIIGALAPGAGGSLMVSNGSSVVAGWTAWVPPSSVAQGDIWYGSALNTLTALAKNTSATRYLSNTGTSNNPAWAQVDLSNGITGTLPVSHLVAGTTTTYGENIQTGTQNDWTLGTDIIGNTVVLWNGASSLTVTGIDAPTTSGTFFTFKNITSAQIAYFANNSGSSSASNRLRNFVTSDAIPVAASGSATWVYDGLNGFWRMVAHTQGAWITPTFAAGDFTGNASMTWTVASGDVTTDRYLIEGTKVTYQFYYQNTTVGGTPSTDLRRAIPTLLTPKTAGEIVATWGRNLDNGTANDGFTYTFGTGGLYLFLRRDKTSGNWAAATDNTSIQGTHIWELV